MHKMPQIRQSRTCLIERPKHLRHAGVFLWPVLWYNSNMFSKDTELGKIHFPVSVIERIIKDAVSGCDGKVSLENYKGRYMGAVSGKGWDINETEDGLDIVIYIIIAFGAGISKYSKQIIEYVTDNVENVMGESPRDVRLIVTGVQSGKEITKRHIEIPERD